MIQTPLSVWAGAVHLETDELFGRSNCSCCLYNRTSTKQVGVAVMLCIQEEPNSNLGWDASYPDQSFS
jgi:hypothetical protein